MNVRTYLLRLKRAAVLETVWICLLMSELILAIGLAVLNSGQWRFSAVLVIAAAIETLAYLLYVRSESRMLKTYANPLAFPVPQNRIANVSQGKLGQMIDKSAYLFLETSESGAVRELIQITERFDAKQLGTERKRLNRIINKRFNVSSTMTLYAKDYRVNLVVFETSRKAAEQWVNANAEQLLRRSEAIINAAIDGDANELLFPALQERIDLRQFQRYRAALFLLESQFGFEI